MTADGEFVVRDLKVIEGTSGPFVAMPSRKLADKCRKCGCKNHLRARYCNECGASLNEHRPHSESGARMKLHADVAHPINTACREQIQNAVLEAYRRDLERSKEPGYQPPTLDENGDIGADDYDQLITELQGSASSRAAERSRSDKPGGQSWGGEARQDRPAREVAEADSPELEPLSAEPADSTVAEPDSPTPTPTPPPSPPDDDDPFSAGISGT